jgi:hypothetical protein
LDTGRLEQEIPLPFNGAIVSLRWIPKRDGTADAFTFGCGDGCILIYAKQGQKVSFCLTVSLEILTNIGMTSLW